MAEEKDPNYKGDYSMTTKISNLNPIELRVYGELAHVSVNGVCATPMTTMKYRCGLSVKAYKDILNSLETKGLIEQKIQGRGVPRTIRLVSEWDRIKSQY